MEHNLIPNIIRTLADRMLFNSNNPLHVDGKMRDPWDRHGPLLGMLFGYRAACTNYKHPDKPEGRAERLFLLSERYHCFIGEPQEDVQRHTIKDMCRTFNWRHVSSHDSAWQSSITDEVFRVLMGVYKEAYGENHPTVPAHADYFQQFGVRMFDPYVFVKLDFTDDKSRNEREHHHGYWKILGDVEEVKHHINIRLPEKP